MTLDDKTKVKWEKGIQGLLDVVGPSFEVLHSPAVEMVLQGISSLLCFSLASKL